MVGTPWTWAHRAKAALFLHIERWGRNLLKKYFRQLSEIHDTESAIWILTEVVDVYYELNYVLRSSNVRTKNSLTFPWQNSLYWDFMQVNRISLTTIFQLILNCGWDMREKKEIILQTKVRLKRRIRQLSFGTVLFSTFCLAFLW